MIEINESINFNGVSLINFYKTSDFEKKLILSWRNDPSIRSLMYDDSEINYNKHISFIESLINDKTKVYFLVKNIEYIGVISLVNISFRHNRAYLGIYKNPSCNISGKILIESLFYVAFKILNLHTLKLEVREDNIKAIKFYESCGFKVEGCLIDFVKSDDSWKNVLIMGKINDG